MLLRAFTKVVSKYVPQTSNPLRNAKNRDILNIKWEYFCTKWNFTERLKVKVQIQKSK